MLALLLILFVAATSLHCRSLSPCVRLKSRSVSVQALESNKPHEGEDDDPDVVYIDSEDDLPENVRFEMDGRYSDGPDIPMRLKSMGFTPLTIAGYVIAFSIIGLNNILGDGWASNMLGMSREDLTTGSRSGVVVDPKDVEQVRSLQKALFESYGKSNDDNPTPITSR